MESDDDPTSIDPARTCGAAGGPRQPHHCGGQHSQLGQGAVFTLSNGTATNRVLAWQRADDGSLLPAGAVSTGGQGTGAGLGSQGALTLSNNHRWLYAVNPGSDDRSPVFRVRGTHLSLVEVASSGGDMPISVTARRRTVYVLNAGGDGNIQGFHRSPSGMLTTIPGSNQPLSQAAPGPAQVGFSPNGRHLVVTEKGHQPDLLRTGQRSGRGRCAEFASVFGEHPVWVCVHQQRHAGRLGGFRGSARRECDVPPTASGPTATSGSSDGSVATTETAACWVAITSDGKCAYVTNTGSGSVSGYSLSGAGDLTLLDADGVTASTGAGSSPIDVAFDGASQHMYVLEAGSDAISIFGAMADGSLADLGEITSLPDGAAGLAAY